MFRQLTTNLRKTIYFLRRNGLKLTYYTVCERMMSNPDGEYHFIPLSDGDVNRQREECRLIDEPVFSILVPVYQTPERYFRELLESVLAQTYPAWELILADSSKEDSRAKIVDEYGDKRIRYVRLKENLGISGNSNEALKYVTGAYVGLLDHDDLLTPDALYEMNSAIQKESDACLLFSDEDKCDGDAVSFYEPHMKEKFNLDMLLANNYFCHFLVMKTEWIKELGFRGEYDGAQDYDLILRGVEKALAQKEEHRIVHIGKVLYHWRCHIGSTAENPQSKEYAYEAGRRALQAFADRQNYHAKAIHLPHLGFYRLVYGENIFGDRPDLGAIGGKLIHKGKICGGRMDANGNVYYEGLSSNFSGQMHKAVLTQDAECVDIRFIRVRKECRELFEEIVGVPYREIPGTEIFDAKVLPKDMDHRKVSAEFGKALREEGYRILWDPALRSRI